MGNRQSVATISSPEFINITSISPFASKCEIKVFYLGKNRNGSFIDKQVATEMAQTLPGCPIVGYFSQDKDDFRDHGEQIIIDGEGVKFKNLTVPYGFVAPDAKVWFQDFEDTDELGNKAIRTYLMTEGFLWTEQYQEAQRVLSEGRPQSMELDNNTLKGHWSTDNNTGLDFFIINDAIFSKLCILGEDVEPCFEGATVSAPDVSSTFSKNDQFTKTLYSMMKELKELTSSLNEKGGNSMELQTENVEEVQQTETNTVEENFSENSDKNVSENIAENQNITEEFVKKNDEKEEKEESSDNKEDANAKDEKTDDANEDEDEEQKKKASKNSLNEDANMNIEEKYALLEQQLNDLKQQYTALEEEKNELMNFKASVEEKEKDALIDSFYMLSDEDKKDVIENKAKYSLDDIEAKLSVICVRKKVNFDLDDDKNNEEEASPAYTFNLNNVDSDPSLPAWIKAVEARRQDV